MDILLVVLGVIGGLVILVLVIALFTKKNHTRFRDHWSSINRARGCTIM